MPESEIDAGLEVYSGVSRQRGLPEWDRSKVVSPAKHRLYRATAHELFVLDSHDERQPVLLD